MEVGDLVKIKDPGNHYSSHFGIIASFSPIHYGGTSYPHVLVGGILYAFARKNLEVISGGR